MDRQTAHTEARVFHQAIFAVTLGTTYACGKKARIIHRLPRCLRLTVNNSACSVDTHQIANRGAKTACANQPQFADTAFLTTQAENPVTYSPGSAITHHPPSAWQRTTQIDHH
jgi:hypothetical protein